MSISERQRISRRLRWWLGLCGCASLSAQEYAPPAGYYDAITATAGTALKQQLNLRVENHTILTYTQARDNMRLVDRDPDNSLNIFLIYSGFSIPYTDGGWNREHMFPQSYGTGSTSSSAFTEGPGYSDLHHLFPADSNANTARSNRYFDVSSNGTPVPNAPGSTYDGDSFEPRDGDKGRVARALFYMDTRYDGDDLSRPAGSQTPDLNLSDFPNRNTYTMGKLGRLLEWNRKYAPDERERRRNHLIMIGGKIGLRNYAGQNNRNPFIDYPELADAVYTSSQYVTTGSWKVAHFSLVQLDDPAVSGDLADPDADGWANLIELSGNLDPFLAEASDAPRFVRTQSGAAFLNFGRLKQFGQSGLEYRIEAGTDPLLELEWSDLPYTENDLQVVERDFTEYVSIGDYLLPPAAGPWWLRLRVVRHYPLDAPGEALAEPFRSADWQDSSWLGAYVDAHFPWTYAAAAGWLWITESSRGSIRLWHPEAGWLLSGADIFPYAWRPENAAWTLLELRDGGLWLYDFTTMGWTRP